MIWVEVGKERTDGKQDRTKRQCRNPLILEDSKADTSVRGDVTGIEASGEMYLGWLEGMISGKMNIQKENASGIWRVIWSHNRCLPVEHIISDWSS